jgi:DNA end-binding protein Ku
MPRPIWSGSVSFGLVSVPVKLFSATSPKEVRFHMLHDKDGGRIHQKRVCSVDGQEVPWEHIVKGYEVSKGKAVTVTKDELESFSPKANKAIEIEDFVGLDQIDPIYYETTYYLVPDKGAAKPYALLVEAMKRTGKVGIARIVLRTKQSLCAVRPMGKVLAVSLMLYADEVVSADDLDGRAGRALEAGGARTEDGRAAHRVVGREVQSGEVQGRLPRAGDGADREEAGRRGDRGG